MSGSRILLIVLAVVVGALLFRASGSASALQYVADWDEARAESRATGKPLMVNFGGPW